MELNFYLRDLETYTYLQITSMLRTKILSVAYLEGEGRVIASLDRNIYIGNIYLWGRKGTNNYLILRIKIIVKTIHSFCA